MPLQPPFRIPEISDARLFELARRIRPLVERGQKRFAIALKLTNYALRNTSYPWEEPDGQEIAASELRSLVTFKTLHAYGYYGFFKPSVAEVLAQLPEEYAERDYLFFFVEGPDTAADLNKELPALNAGFHVADTTLYEQAR